MINSCLYNLTNQSSFSIISILKQHEILSAFSLNEQAVLSIVYGRLLPFSSLYLSENRWSYVLSEYLTLFSTNHLQAQGKVSRKEKKTKQLKVNPGLNPCLQILVPVKIL